MNKPGKSEEPMKDSAAGGQQVMSESHAGVKGSQEGELGLQPKNDGSGQTWE